MNIAAFVEHGWTWLKPRQAAMHALGPKAFSTKEPHSSAFVKQEWSTMPYFALLDSLDQALEFTFSRHLWVQCQPASHTSRILPCCSAVADLKGITWHTDWNTPILHHSSPRLWHHYTPLNCSPSCPMYRDWTVMPHKLFPQATDHIKRWQVDAAREYNMAGQNHETTMYKPFSTWNKSNLKSF